MTMLGHMSRLAAVGIHLAGVGIAMSMPNSPPPAPMREIPITLSMAPPEPPAPGSVKIIDAYNARLQSWVQRHHRYPGQARSKREQGTALVWFVIDRDGRLQNCKIQRSSGSAVLDDAALKTLRRSSPFPAAPEEIKDVVIERVIPVDFYIR